MTYSPTYWSGKGKYQKEYDILWKKYIPAEGNKIRTGNAQATKSLKKLLSLSRKYYRFYNDGDSFTFEGRRYYYYRGISEGEMKPLDRVVDRVTLDAWRKTKKATL